MATIIHTNAKDFSRHPELLVSHIDRIKRANAAARGYMRDSDLFTVGLIGQDGFLADDHAQLVADEIAAAQVGEAKRAETLAVNAGPASRDCAFLLRDEVCGLFTRFKAEVLDKFAANTFLQHLYNAPDDNDEQKVFHSDTFFPAIKFWYFPQAVGPSDGPLMYVPNSPILTPQLLGWHQAQVESIKRGTVESWRGRGHREGSLRISEKEITKLGLTPCPITVEANTLIIANVFGFHRRGDTTKPTHRLSIHGSIRVDNPL